MIPFQLLLLKVFHAQKNRVRPLILAAGLTPGQPKILSALLRRGSARQRELAECCDIEPATISKLLGSMEELGLIARAGVSGDRRAAEVTITARGRRIQQDLEAQFQQIQQEALAGFSETERAELERYLHRLYRNLTGSPLDF